MKKKIIEGTSGLDLNIYISSDGKIGVIHINKDRKAKDFDLDKDIFYKWRTKEEWDEYYRLYSHKNFTYTGKEAFVNTLQFGLKDLFAERLKNVFNAIEKNWNTYWVARHSHVDRTCIQKMLSGEILPSIQNLLRLIIFINNHIDNFDMLYLFAPQVDQMQREDNYKIGTIEKMFLDEKDSK